MTAKRKPRATPSDRDSNSQRRRSFIKADYLRLAPIYWRRFRYSAHLISTLTT